MVFVVACAVVWTCVAIAFYFLLRARPKQKSAAESRLPPAGQWVDIVPPATAPGAAPSAPVPPEAVAHAPEVAPPVPPPRPAPPLPGGLRMDVPPLEASDRPRLVQRILKRLRRDDPAAQTPFLARRALWIVSDAVPPGATVDVVVPVDGAARFGALVVADASAPFMVDVRVECGVWSRRITLSAVPATTFEHGHPLAIGIITSPSRIVVTLQNTGHATASFRGVLLGYGLRELSRAQFDEMIKRLAAYQPCSACKGRGDVVADGHLPPDRFFGWGPWRDLSGVEPGIRAICEQINASGWCWTAESCEGHADATPSDGWGGPRPMLRFVCRTVRVGELMTILAAAAKDSRCAVTIHPGAYSDADWSDVLTYVDGPDLDRRRAMYAAAATLISATSARPTP